MSVLDIGATLAPGELCLLAGPTGSGRSSRLRAADPGAALLRTVPQRAADGLGADTVRAELGRSLRGHRRTGTDRLTAQSLDRYGLVDLLDRRIDSLSTGEAQAVAVIAALAAAPDVLLLDEPTAALDPVLADTLLAAARAFAVEQGRTVLLTEHRLERVAAHADTVLVGPYRSPTADVLARADLVPPVVALSRLLQWSPVALTVEAARQAAATHPLPPVSADDTSAEDAAPVSAARDEIAARTRGLAVSHGRRPALTGVDLSVRAGEIVVLTGTIGSGKTALLHALAGLDRPSAGTVRVGGHDPARMGRRERGDAVGLLPADPSELFLAGRVDAECAGADRAAGAAAGRTAALLADLLPGLPLDRHPGALSAGQQTALGLAIVLTRAPAVLLLDEPTGGLDARVKQRLATTLRRLAAAGHAVVVATHDVEFAAGVADRVVRLAGGSVAADDPAIDALTRTPGWCTQVAQIMAPAPLLTVPDVRRELLSPITC